MIGRPMLREKVRLSTPEAWFRRPVRDIPEGDMWRWWAISRAANYDYRREERE